jgi:acetyl-CoA C-acetyltransferase
MWEYRNPGKLVRDALGCSNAKSILAGLGVLQLGLVADLCREIAAGERELGVVVGGEAKYRRLRGNITGQTIPETVDDDAPPPDLHETSVDPWCSDLEAFRGLNSPTEFFAIIESAMRHARGLGVERHRDELAALYSRFSAIAAENPHAWKREPLAAETIREAGPRNAMQAFPYAKLHCSNWNVNQAVAILVCSAGRARALGLPQRGWIYPLAYVQSRHVVPLAQQRRLDTRPGTVLVGKRALALAGITTRDLAAAELYSCFPAAIQSFARDLEIPPECPWTVTGSMAFAGGPFNNATLEGVARMVEVLRSDSSRRYGLVSNLSGIFSKQACAILSNAPGPDDYRDDDITAAVAAQSPLVPLDADYVGSATIAGYTVVFQGNEPAHAIAYCDLPDGKRTVVRSTNRALLDTMTREEMCGRAVEVRAGGDFTVRP